MSSIMRRRRGLKSAISILLSEGVGCNTHTLSGRRRSTPPRRSRRGSGFVQSRSKSPISGKSGHRKTPFPVSKSTAWDFFTDNKIDVKRQSKGPLSYAYSGTPPFAPTSRLRLLKAELFRFIPESDNGSSSNSCLRSSRPTAYACPRKRLSGRFKPRFSLSVWPEYRDLNLPRLRNSGTTRSIKSLRPFGTVAGNTMNPSAAR